MNKKPASLYPYREARITPAMWIVGTIMIIIIMIIAFILFPVPTLA